jgi:hypothetical protein
MNYIDIAWVVLGVALSVPVEMYFHHQSVKDTVQANEQMRNFIGEVVHGLEVADPDAVSRDAAGVVTNVRIPMAPSSRVQWQKRNPQTGTPDDRGPRVYWGPAIGRQYLDVGPPPGHT